MPGLRITQGFGSRHPGIDIAVPTGTPIYAPEPLQLQRVGYDASGYGNYVLARGLDSGVVYRFAHLAQPPAVPRTGQYVPGMLVGNTGSTGQSSGPHLHLEVLRDGGAVDPFQFFGEQIGRLFAARATGVPAMPTASSNGNRSVAAGLEAGLGQITGPLNLKIDLLQGMNMTDLALIGLGLILIIIGIVVFTKGDAAAPAIAAGKEAAGDAVKQLATTLVMAAV